jgi:hypothetical protein
MATIIATTAPTVIPMASKVVFTNPRSSSTP